MKHLLFALLLSVFFSLAAHAQARGYPYVLHSSTCVDLYDVAGSAGSVYAHVESSGSPNDQCDYDNRVLTGAVADRHVWVVPAGAFNPERMLWIYVNGTDVTTVAQTWRLDFLMDVGDGLNTKRHFDVTTAALTGNVSGFYIMNTTGQSGQVTETFTVSMPAQDWEIEMELITATAWEGDLILMQ